MDISNNYPYCLKKLTEDIIKKQNDSLKSINLLCLKTDTVSSDISNLINSLQMVGNRQFAENRVRDDDSTNGQSQIHQQQQPKNISMTTTTITSPQVPVSSCELKLSSILLKAIELVPDEEDDTLLPPTTPPSPSPSPPSPSSPPLTAPPQQQQQQQQPPPPPPPPPPPALIPPQPTTNDEPQSVRKEEGEEEQPIKSRSVDRDHITDILKRYSLYDDDEDDESE